MSLWMGGVAVGCVVIVGGGVWWGGEDRGGGQQPAEAHLTPIAARQRTLSSPERKANAVLQGMSCASGAGTVTHIKAAAVASTPPSTHTYCAGLGGALWRA